MSTNTYLSPRDRAKVIVDVFNSISNGRIMVKLDDEGIIKLATISNLYSDNRLDISRVMEMTVPKVLDTYPDLKYLIDYQEYIHKGKVNLKEVLRDHFNVDSKLVIHTSRKWSLSKEE